MKTGVIGLGAMGANMARNLASKNQLETVYNRTLATAESLARECGYSISMSPAELVLQCELVILSVSRDEDVLEIVNAIKAEIKPGTIVIDTSTVRSDTARKATIILNAANAHFLDCPVSGGVEGARSGTLAMMVGGDEAILEKARPILNIIADNIVYIGPSGFGQATKAVNQIMVAGINQAVTEALVFGEAMGLPMDKVVDIVSTGAAGNWFLAHRGKPMLAGSYAPGFKLALHHKDLKIGQSMIKSSGNDPLSVIEMTLSAYQDLMNEGYGDEDISALFRLKKRDRREC